MMVRPEAPEDVETIRAVVRAAFEHAPHNSGTEAAIVDALRNAGALSLSLVAEVQNELAGHIAFSPVTVDGKPGRWFGLGPVAVGPDRQRAGVGAALIREGLAQLKAAGAHGCVVLGEPAYYRRFGFVADLGLRYEGAPPEYLQRITFIAPPPSGTIAYHRGFEAR